MLDPSPGRRITPAPSGARELLMTEAEGFFPERLVLRLRATSTKAVTGTEGPPASAFGGTSPWVWFIVFMPAWIGGIGASNWHVSPGVVGHVLKDSLHRNSLVAGLYATAGLAIGMIGLAVYLAIKGRGVHRPV